MIDLKKLKQVSAYMIQMAKVDPSLRRSGLAAKSLNDAYGVKLYQPLFSACDKFGASDLLGRRQMTPAEAAIFTSFHLYCVASSASFNADGETPFFKALAKANLSKSGTNRILRLWTCQDQKSAIELLTGLVRLAGPTKIDFNALAIDLYFFYLGGDARDNTLHAWARDYY